MNTLTRKRRGLLSWQNPKLVVRNTGRYAKGVFARRAIVREEVLFVMAGKILPLKDEMALPPRMKRCPIAISTEFSPAPRTLRDLPLMPQFYVNHSCAPNAGFRGELFVVAMRDISTGEEITYDYAMCSDSLWWKMERACRCSASQCRGTITGGDWKIPALQRRYGRYFQPYLQEMIRAVRRER